MMKTLEVYIVVMLIVVTSSSSFGEETETELLNRLFDPDRYDQRIRPPGPKGEPTRVLVDLFVQTMSSISDADMDYRLTMFLRQEWKDRRLASDSRNETLTLNYRFADALWLPDIYMVNEKEGVKHDITVPNILLRLQPDGTVYFSQRISALLTCNMNLATFPMDEHMCTLKMESYGFTTNELEFVWRGENPVQIEEGITLPEHLLLPNATQVDDCTGNYITGAFSCKIVRFSVVRLFKFYMIQLYLPTALIVCLSWVSFWLDIDAVPARISLGLLTVLTITTWSNDGNSLPPVSYVKAIDSWMFMCVTFVFLAVVEFCVVNVVRRRELTREKNQYNSFRISQEVIDVIRGFMATPGSYNPKLSELSMIEDQQPESYKRVSWRAKIRTNKAYLIDFIARILFPLTFVAFNIGYWWTYLIPKLNKIKK